MFEELKGSRAWSLRNEGEWRGKDGGAGRAGLVMTSGFLLCVYAKSLQSCLTL